MIHLDSFKTRFISQNMCIRLGLHSVNTQKAPYEYCKPEYQPVDQN